jgi:hypothetical protein
MMIEELMDIFRLTIPELEESTVKKLFDSGFFSHKTCIIFIVKYQVAKLYKAGLGKMEAMQMVADEHGLSFDSVVNYVYKNKDVKLL